MTARASLALLVSTAFLGACATTTAAPIAPIAPIAPLAPVDAPAPEPAAAPVVSAHDQLFQLFKDSDEANLKLNPIGGIFRGDARFGDSLGDGITDAYFDAARKLVEADMQRLRTIDRSQLNETDQLAYDVFEYSGNDGLIGLSSAMLSLTAVRPLNHFFGFQTFYPTFANGKGAAPFKTVVDYENNLKRHTNYAWWVDQAIIRFKQGAESNVVETKMTVRNVIEQLDNQLKQTPEESQFYGPIKQFPAEFSAADKARLTAAHRAAIVDEIFPALTRLRDYLKSDYLPKARDGYGIMYMKGGDQLYRYLVRSTTTLDMFPDEIHQLGLSEVARITGEMEKVKNEVGFKGSLAKFFDHLRTDPKFKMKSREALTQGYYDIGKAVDARLPEYFSTIPKTKLEIQIGRAHV